MFVDGENVSDLIPEDLRTSSMNIYGTYSSWHFENWMEVFDDYRDGLEYNEWIEENKSWLDKITTDKDTQELIFQAIQAQDFRYCSCGGCI